MNSAMKTRIGMLAAAVSVVALVGMSVTASAGKQSGGLGGLGGAINGAVGAVGGVVGGTVGSVSGAVGGVTGAVGGTVNGVTAGLTGSTSTSSLQGFGQSTSTMKQSLYGSPLTKKALVRLKLNVLGIRAGIYVLDRYGNLIRVNAKVFGLAKVKANVYALKHGNLVKINAKLALAGLKVSGKVFVIDQYGNLLRGKAFIALGGINAKATTKVGLNGVDLKIGVSIGGRKLGGPGDPGGPGNPGGTGSPGNPRGITHEIASLPTSERRALKKKCVSVLERPTAYSRDAVQVCRVLAQLAGA